MGLFDTFFSRTPSPSRPPAVKVEVPASLPTIGERSATEVAGKCGLRPVPGATDSVPDCVRSLVQENRPIGATQVLAHSLPPRDGVRWATDACNLAAEKQTPVDRSAAAAAQTWLSQPSASNAEQAGKSAALAQHAGPGAWAAQAAQWAQGDAQQQSLVGNAVAGAVMLAAALTKPGLKLPDVPAVGTAQPISMPGAGAANELPAPAPENAETLALYAPFLNRGIAIAAGRV